MGTPTQALAAANSVLAALGGFGPPLGVGIDIGSPSGKAGKVLVDALVAAAGSPARDAAYAVRFAQCQAICLRAGVSFPSYDDDSGTFTAMQTAMGSAISSLSTALGAAAAFVLIAASASNNDLALQFSLIGAAIPPASSAAIDALLAEATAFISYVAGVG
jgi:hypothetical protein